MATKADQRFKVDSGLAVLHAVRDTAGTNRPFSAREIADCVGCSAKLITEIEQRALRKLRHPSRMNELRKVLA